MCTSCLHACLPASVWKCHGRPLDSIPHLAQTPRPPAPPFISMLKHCRLFRPWWSTVMLQQSAGAQSTRDCIQPELDRVTPARGISVLLHSSDFFFFPTTSLNAQTGREWKRAVCVRNREREGVCVCVCVCFFQALPIRPGWITFLSSLDSGSSFE